MWFLFLLSNFWRGRIPTSAEIDLRPPPPHRQVVWRSVEPSTLSIAVPFLEIVMHALSTDPSSFSRPCIYAQLQSGFAEEEGYLEEEVDQPEVEDEESVSLEMRLCPAAVDSCK